MPVHFVCLTVGLAELSDTAIMIFLCVDLDCHRLSVGVCSCGGMYDVCNYS